MGKPDIHGPALLATVVFLRSFEKSEKVQHHVILSTGYPYTKMSFQVYEYIDTTVDSYWIIQSIPKSSADGAIKQVKVGCRQGIFINNSGD